MSPSQLSVTPFQVNEPELRDFTRPTITPVLNAYTRDLTTAQEYLAGRLASGTMADWTWKADVSPNQERKYLHPTTTQEVASLIVQASVDFARNRPETTTSAMNDLAVSPVAHALRANTLQSLRLLLDRRARGQ